jgi:hypothetical protein
MLLNLTQMVKENTNLLRQLGQQTLSQRKDQQPNSSAILHSLQDLGLPVNSIVELTGFNEVLKSKEEMSKMVSGITRKLYDVGPML